MCLGIPGKITSILDEGSITRTGKVSFGGVLKDINLSYVPEANFVGTVQEINADRGSMKVQVEIFERLTSIEVEFWQVEPV